MWTIFRIAADMSHITAKCILVFSIHRNRSSEGVSLLTQLFYALVFVTRYTDLFRESYAWNYFFKVFYLLSSFYTIAIMRFVYPRTREREVAWKLSALILAGCLILSPFVMLIFDPSDWWSFQEYLWVFSQVLESLCVLPQLLLLRQTTIPTVITSFYIVFLGSYRGLYLLNWILKELDTNMKKPNPISVIFGVIQTALYLDFGWVYWSRQRVKLRNGGVVDADDLSRGWLLRRIFGNKQFARDIDGSHNETDDEESAPALHNGFNHHQGGGSNNNGGGGVRPKWGSRGISISADEGVLEHERARGQALDDDGGYDDDDEEHGVTNVVDPDAKMRDPDELARALDEEEDLDAAPGGSSSQQKKKEEEGGLHPDARGEPSGVRNGDEWNDD
ncbi:ER lumen protein retaining receptor-domain-containing protein [Parachaetomium inaequale]|uniref:ER lumen protein retaining receptor-domain-containing protein n=1 Tax=Parachaetomium inaequale TaxID=2588326 RepID=A0AAN6SMS3_9PEZI|nr:ER lumen protein retaining receptor-domain-containing protein [Parachaetomium inaequale]